MPTSHYHQLNEIVELIRLTQPVRVLDIGVGFGKFGFLTREYLDVYDSREYGKWATRIDGVEVFESYIGPIQRLVYDNIYIGDARRIVPELETRYDLILLIDVIEHLPRESGEPLLDACLRVGRNVLVSTPKGTDHQADAFGNPHEAHRSHWRRSDFRRLSNSFFVRSPVSVICFAGEDAGRIRVLRLIMRFGLIDVARTLRDQFPAARKFYHMAQKRIGRGRAKKA